MTGQTGHPTPTPDPLTLASPAQQRRQEKKDHALLALRQYGTIERAAEAAGVSRATLYRWREADPAFEAEVKQWLEEDMEDELHATLFTIAKLGTTDAKYANAAVKAAELLIKAENREKYGDQLKTESTQTINVQVELAQQTRNRMRDEHHALREKARQLRTLDMETT